jgi:hypothetical protein
MTDDDARLVRGYLEFAYKVVSGDRNAPQWAMEAVDELVRDNPDTAWSIIVKLIAGATDDRVLAFVAAGPLEDLLQTHGPRVMNYVEELAKSDRKFRRALTAVWISSPSDIAQKIETLVAGEPRL